MVCNTTTTITAEDLQEFKPNLVFINDVADTETLTATAPNGTIVKTIGGWNQEFAYAVAGIGWQPEIPYTSGIYFADTDFNKLVGYLDNSYAPIASQLPFTTTGTWAIDSSKFKQINSSVISVNGEAGAVTITLADLGGVPTTRTINGNALSSNITIDLEDLGYTGDTDANNYSHPIFVTRSETATGLEVISKVSCNGEGHVTDIEKRTLSPDSINAVPNNLSSDINAGENTQLTIISGDEGASVLSVIGTSQGVGRVYVGQSNISGGGLNYDGNGLDDLTGAGADTLAIYRKNNGLASWTAKNSVTSDDWYFKGDIYINETQLVLTDENLDLSDYARLDSTQYFSNEIYVNGDEKVLTEENLDLSDYGKLSSDQEWSGVNTFSRSTDGDLIKLAHPSDVSADISIFIGTYSDTVSYRLTYHGTGLGNENDISLNSSTKTLFRSSQDGIVNFPNGLKFNGNEVLTEVSADGIYARTDSSAAFDGDIYANETDKVYNTGNITSGTPDPTGGSDGDIYIQLDS